MYTFGIGLKNKPDFEYGQHLWVIEPVRFAEKVFTSLCPVCGGAGTIIHNGYELKCPYCETGLGMLNAENEITLYRYEIAEYIINELTITGDRVKAAYTKDGLKTRPPHVSRCAGFKVGSRTEPTRINGSFYKLDGYENPSFKTMISPQHGYHITDYHFTDRKIAETRLAELIEYEKARLAEFNKKNNTEYEYPW